MIPFLLTLIAAQVEVIPTSEITRGHGTHTVAAAWQQFFAPFVAALEAHPAR
jgi:hypothetical protein